MISNPLPWPNDAKCAVAFTWDMDAESGLNYYHPNDADNLVYSQSTVRYGPKVAVPRIVEMGRQFNIPQTFFLPGWCVEKYPAAVELLLENEHEAALHGYLHERPNELSAEDELYCLRRGIDAFVRKIGVRPRRWRAPSFAFSKFSLEYVIAEGFDYDSSLGGDDIPYMLRHETGSLLELPGIWTMDDWPQYMHSRDFNYFMQVMPPARAIEVSRAEFDSAWLHGGFWMSIWHPFVSGRPARLNAVVGLIEHMQGKGDVWFARLDEVCDHVRRLMDDGSWAPCIEVLPY